MARALEVNVMQVFIRNWDLIMGDVRECLSVKGQVCEVTVLVSLSPFLDCLLDSNLQ